ncbi:MAG: ATP-binding protein [Alphaproteobacteria bacterium]
MSDFHIDKDLEIGSVFEVAGSEIKIALSKSITELTRSHSGRVYNVGQIGSLLKMHLGRKILFATVKLLRLQSDEEIAAIQANDHLVHQSQDRRVIEASLLGEAWFDTTSNTLNFKRGVSLYPLPLQAVHLVTKTETEALFISAESASGEDYDNRVDLGDYAGATRVSCRANMDKLFGQHCAILGSTGSGKSSAVAGIIHSVLDAEPREGVKAKPNIVLIDPHGEYGAAFEGKAQLLRAYESLNGDGEAGTLLKLPYWLMSSDEFRSLISGKTEFEATSQANVIYKALAHARMVEAGLCRSALRPIQEQIDNLGDFQHVEDAIPVTPDKEALIPAFDRDKPRPFKLSEFEAHIRHRQAYKPGKNGAWDYYTPAAFESAFSSILSKLNVLRLDPRISFMMREHDKTHPSLTFCIAQLLHRPIDNDSGLKVIDISGIPNEIAGPLTGAICRLLFQYKVFQTREEREKDPVAIICEEAHRYVPDRGEAQYDVAQTAVRRIAREGRKYGLGLVLVSQRPSDVEGTVISQCNSWIVLRLTNSRDQEHVSRFLPDSLSGMTKQLSSLPRQEAIFVGEASALPARIRLRTLSKEQLPKSADISFAKAWSSDPISDDGLSAISDRMTK